MNSLLQLREFQQVAPGLSYALVTSLALSSQLLFYTIDPGSLTPSQAVPFNAVVVAVLLCYTRAWRTDPGRVGKDWDGLASSRISEARDDEMRQSHRYCRRCDMPKPPRSHHCKSCQRCIPKMDHHCPWTANCVSYRTMPHFIRFLFYGTVALVSLECFLWVRLHALYEKRQLPSYLGPTVTQLVALFVITIVNTVTLIGISLLFVRTLWCIAVNTTTIEGWEIERHEALIRRSRRTGGLLDAPNGTRIKIVHQEFPYDIGVWSNIVQAFGSQNVVGWLWPLSASLPLHAGVSFEENGFEDAGTVWPPPDPDKMFRVQRTTDSSQAFTKPLDVDSFKARQAEDMKRYGQRQLLGDVRQRRPFGPATTYDTFHANDRVYELESENEDEDQGVVGLHGESADEDERELPRRNLRDDGETWTNAEGERLADFGVDEDADYYDEDELPLAELLKLRKAQQSG